MTTTITKTFSFEAAHTLTWHPGKCKRLHGHSYKVELEIGGEVDERGIIIDFDDLAPLVQEHVLEIYDHRLINDFLVNPTAERIAADILQRLSAPLRAIAPAVMTTSVSIWETSDNRAKVSE